MNTEAEDHSPAINDDDTDLDQLARLQEENVQLKEQLARQTARYERLWERNCKQMREFERQLDEKDDEIQVLRNGHQKASVNNGDALSRTSSDTSVTLDGMRGQRKGKAPPVDAFDGEKPEITFQDWLPTLQRAATWNGWTEAETLLQLAGHLRGRASQEWALLSEGDRQTLTAATTGLASRLEPTAKAMAAQDFRHLSQQRTEPVSDFIRRLERTFNLAYGRDGMSKETRDILLHGQLQEGLHQHLMSSPAVSGAGTYLELCLAAKNEEKHQTRLQQRQLYRQSEDIALETQRAAVGSRGGPLKPKACYTCGSTTHLARNCKAPSTESVGRIPREHLHAKHVTTSREEVNHPAREIQDDPMAYLASDSDEEHIRRITVEDQGSHAKCVKVEIHQVAMYGIVDTGADITILGGKAFQRIAAKAKLRKKEFKPADKTAYNYDGKPFRLDGKMYLNITFGNRTLPTPVYIKMDAGEQLLLSEGVCRQLGIVSYHPQVEVWRGRRRKTRSNNDMSRAKVPTVRIRIVNSTSGPLLPQLSELEQPLKLGVEL